MDDVFVKQLKSEISDLEIALRVFPPGELGSVGRHLQLQERLAELKTIMAKVDAGEPILNSECIPTEENSSESVEGKPLKRYDPKTPKAKLLSHYKKSGLGKADYLANKNKWPKAQREFFIEHCGKSDDETELIILDKLIRAESRKKKRNSDK